MLEALKRQRVTGAVVAVARWFGGILLGAGPLGRYLLRHGLAVVMVDANGPLEGLPGRYFPGRLPNYFRGPEAPRLGDLAYSEAVLFGP